MLLRSCHLLQSLLVCPQPAINSQRKQQTSAASLRDCSHAVSGLHTSAGRQLASHAAAAVRLEAASLPADASASRLEGEEDFLVSAEIDYASLGLSSAVEEALSTAGFTRPAQVQVCKCNCISDCCSCCASCHACNLRKGQLIIFIFRLFLVFASHNHLLCIEPLQARD